MNILMKQYFLPTHFSFFVLCIYGSFDHSVFIEEIIIEHLPNLALPNEFF